MSKKELSPSEMSFMERADDEARRGAVSGDGGPFGAVVVLGGEVVAAAHNEVLKRKDPTAHAEILAIRRAAERLARFDLSGCAIYSSCEPCPMCLAAIYWSRIGRLAYGCTREDAARIGFDDERIYRLLGGGAAERPLEVLQGHRERCLETFRTWEKMEGRIHY